MTDKQELRLSDALVLWRAHGGSTFGPHVETVSMPESKFMGFCRALAARAPDPELAKVTAERDEALAFVAELQTALSFWLPSVTPEVDVETNGRVAGENWLFVWTRRTRPAPPSSP